MEPESINVKLRELYKEYVNVLEEGDAERAIETGVKILEELLSITRKNVLESLSNPFLKELALNILLQYERELSFVRGAQEAVKSMPPLYASDVTDKALETLSSSINGLFNFTVGALIVIADVVMNIRAMVPS
ncbi:MAG: hypothetical protein NZ954_02650 [Thermofilaceae archaeon]|nr:hypothetical protein [Thermofilaceae archaeon]MDW8004775.1 hypothetical protein [Thermofilaceae archaeon]